MNVPNLVGLVISAKLATLHEMQTVYGIEDLHDLAEIMAIDGHNAHAIAKREK